jgi:hypothetical protein
MRDQQRVELLPHKLRRLAAQRHRIVEVGPDLVERLLDLPAPVVQRCQLHRRGLFSVQPVGQQPVGRCLFWAARGTLELALDHTHGKPRVSGRS